MKFYETKAFKELEVIWNEKLADSGFDDAERNKNGERYLKKFAGSDLHLAVKRDSSRKDYYDMLLQFANSHVFTSGIDKLVMQMWASGARRGEIATELLIHRKTVRCIIRRYEHKWGIRSWTFEERNMVSRYTQWIELPTRS